MIIEHIETDPFTAWYDTEEGILHVNYRGVLTPEATVQFYRWLGGIIQRNPQEVGRAKGSIYDFRGVTGFDKSNLTSAQRQSKQLNMQVDMSGHPVALLVETALQERILIVELSISPQQDRKRIVRTEAEALAFIDSFQVGG